MIPIPAWDRRKEEKKKIAEFLFSLFAKSDSCCCVRRCRRGKFTCDRFSPASSLFHSRILPSSSSSIVCFWQSIFSCPPPSETEFGDPLPLSLLNHQPTPVPKLPPFIRCHVATPIFFPHTHDRTTAPITFKRRGGK